MSDRAGVLLKSGRRLDLLDPDPYGGWTDEDLATGLARTHRWGGHSAWDRSAAFRRPAQHHGAAHPPGAGRTGADRGRTVAPAGARHGRRPAGLRRDHAAETPFGGRLLSRRAATASGDPNPLRAAAVGLFQLCRPQGRRPPGRGQRGPGRRWLVRSGHPHEPRHHDRSLDDRPGDTPSRHAPLGAVATGPLREKPSHPARKPAPPVSGPRTRRRALDHSQRRIADPGGDRKRRRPTVHRRPGRRRRARRGWGLGPRWPVHRAHRGRRACPGQWLVLHSRGAAMIPVAQLAALTPQQAPRQPSPARCSCWPGQGRARPRRSPMPLCIGSSSGACRLRASLP